MLSSRGLPRKLRLVTILASAAALVFIQTANAQLKIDAGIPQARFLTGEADAIDDWPCFSPDGKLILFSRSRDKGKTWELFVVPAVGGDAKQFVESPLPPPVAETRADWSVRSNRIAFAGVTAGQASGLWLLDSNVAAPLPLKTAVDLKQLYYPSWYPDGRRILAMDAQDLVLKVFDTVSGKVESITDRAKMFAGKPSVSPDGKSIAFAGQPRTGQPYDQNKNSIWLIQNGGEPTLLEHDALQGRSPAWSPDSKHVVFESDRASGHYAIYVADVDGTNVHRLTDFALNATHPSWSSNGRLVVFSTRQSKSNASIAISELP